MVLALGSVAIATSTTRSSAPDTPGRQRPVASAALSPVDGSGPQTADVEMYDAADGRTRMEIRAADLPAAGTGEFYYAWLLDPGTQKMLPLGQLGPGGASFDVPASTVASYSAIDVSLEADDGDPAHSVTSVLRGTY